MDVNGYLDQALWDFHDKLEEEWHARTPRIPEILYHYTSATAFRSIIETKKLWATASTHLNDVTEVTHAGSLLGKILDKFAESIIDKNERHLIFPSTLLSIPYGRDGIVHSFVASLSTAEDDRTQWHMYATGGYGISIGFDSEKLTRRSRASIRSRTTFGIESIMYGQEEQEEFCSFAVDLWLNRARTELVAPLPPTVWRPTYQGCWYSIFAGCVSGFLPRMKSHHFRSEGEWRLAHLHSQRCHCLVKERTPGSIPYVELPLSYGVSHLPISFVWLGPGYANDPSEETVRKFLNIHGYTSVAIKRSGVPLRIEQKEITL